MSTQQYPQLPGAAPGSAPAPNGYASQPAYYGPPAPLGPPASVPPIPPPGRSTGFWVGISCAIAVGVVAALLIGFFIGRGTRLSNESVQGKIVQQSQSDQIAEQQALDQQRSALAAKQARAVAEARHNAYAAGRTAGFSAGQQAGFNTGQSEGFAQGQATGLAQGETTGFSQGLNQGACFANSIFCAGG
jgi:hypothetical protein